jgi:hypothetical protein
MQQEEKDSVCSKLDGPPSSFFDIFVRKIKNALGPSDALVFWLLQANFI